MALGKIVWNGNRLFWQVSDVDVNGWENMREIEIRRSKRWCANYPLITREEIKRYDEMWGYVVSPEIEMPGIASIVLVIRYYDGAAHVIDGPYRIGEGV
jgi:hypothetical protein